MCGSRKAFFAAVLACCTPAAATEPASPPRLGSLLRNGWGVPSEARFIDSMAEEGAFVNAAADAVPVVDESNAHGPVVQEPLMLDPVVQPEMPDSSSATNSEPRAVTEAYPAASHPQKPVFEALQIDRAPAVSRLQPPRSSAGWSGRASLGCDNPTRVIAATPIDEVGLPLTITTEPSQDDTPQQTAVCDLVGVAIAESKSNVVDEQQWLEVVPRHSVSRAQADTERLPDADAVASLFQDLQNAEATTATQLLNLPPGSRHEVSETDFLLAKQKNLKPGSTDDSTDEIDSWGLIESTNDDFVDPLRQAAKLWELAQQSLQQARQAAVNGEADALRSLAMESLRLCFAALDAAEQTDVSKASFQDALHAMRESNDFCLVEQNVDRDALQVRQIILEHKTDVLKTSEGSTSVSMHEAAYRYMTFARRSLVKASRGIPEASEALMLLGAAESLCIDGNPSHQDAIAVMLQRAAIEICPAESEPHLALGITLSNQGLTEQARLSLQRSVEIKPTQRAYQGLIELAAQVGDKARLEALQVKLQQLAPDSQANIVALERGSDNRLATPGKTPDNEDEKEVKTRIGWRSMIPFVR
jgi:tetratricopeptide (TPR) repeat protein